MKKLHSAPYLLGTFLMTLGMVLSFIPVANASAQSWARSFETPDGLYELEWGADWDADIDDSDSSVSVVTLQSGLSVVSAMFIGDDLGVDLDFFLEEFREGFESGAGSTLAPVDSWESGTSLHSMDLMELDDIEFAIYSTIEEGRLGSGPVLMLFGTLPDAFERSFETLQEEVTLNGDPVFADDDAESLASILDGGTATSSSSSDRSSGRSSRSSSNTSGETSRQSDRRSQGSAYRDSEYGYTVDYSSPWSPASPAAGSLTLQDSSFNTVGFMGMPFFGSRTAFIDIMESSWHGSGGVYLGTVETDDRILMVTEVPGGGILAQEIIFMDSTTAVVVSVVLIGDTDAAVRSLQQNVSVNDEPVLRDWNDL